MKPLVVEPCTPVVELNVDYMRPHHGKHPFPSAAKARDRRTAVWDQCQMSEMSLIVSQAVQSR